jgi:hypothetical protein
MPAPLRPLGAGAAFAICVLASSLVPAAHATGPQGGLDGRGWELVSPVEKNGGEVSLPGAVGAGAFQAAAQGAALAYASEASFGEAAGAAPISQYLARRGAGGWVTENLTPPLLSGTYAGGAYLLFSADLSRALLTGGWRCRGGGECGAENPPLGPGAPVGYRDLYLRELAAGSYRPLITTANAPALAIAPEKLHLAPEGADPELSQVSFSSCAALSAGSTEVPDGEGGCDPLSPNHYRWSEGSLAEVAPEDWEADFDPGGAEVEGVLAASADRSYVYYRNAAGLWLWHAATNTKVAADADASNSPAATGTAHLSADGTRLAFLSSASLTGYPNGGKSEVYLYEAGPGHLLCASCRPNGVAAKGSSTLPGARTAGEGAPPLYKPRALSADGTRLFFDSADAIFATDTNGLPDVYEWEAQGTGGCAKAAGCVGLVSGGRVGASSFLDASADGTDAYFRTDASLLGIDVDGVADVYDARVGGGFPETTPGIPCLGDACQGPAPAPEDPDPATGLIAGRGNPPAMFAKPRKHRRHRKHKHRKHHRGHAGHRRGAQR